MSNPVKQLGQRGARLAKRNLRSARDKLYLLAGPTPAAKLEPNFLIIGAMKAGTTSLHDCLAQHPEVHMTYVKEPSYFLDEEVRVKSSPYPEREQLRKLMFMGYRNQPRIGESSTTYTEAPSKGAEVPENIFRQLPDMQFIYLLRNPLGRIVSHYLHCYERGIYSDPIGDVIAKDPTFLERSLYYSQLERYLKFFPREQFLVLLFEDLIKEPVRELEKVCDFLGVDKSVAPQINTRPKNSSVVDSAVRKNNSRFTPETYESLMEPIRADIDALEKMLDRKLDMWDLSKEKWTQTSA